MNIKNYIILGLLIVSQIVNTGCSTKKYGRTCVVCNTQMEYTDGFMYTSTNHINKFGKYKNAIVKTTNCFETIKSNPDEYFKSPSFFSFLHVGHTNKLKIKLHKGRH